MKNKVIGQRYGIIFQYDSFAAYLFVPVTYGFNGLRRGLKAADGLPFP